MQWLRKFFRVKQSLLDSINREEFVSILLKTVASNTSPVMNFKRRCYLLCWKKVNFNFCYLLHNEKMIHNVYE